MGRHDGAFVYTGSGKKQAKNADAAQVECKQLACAIQWCLAKSNHQQARCEPSVQAWKDCVQKVNEREAATAAAAAAETAKAAK